MYEEYELKPRFSTTAHVCFTVVVLGILGTVGWIVTTIITVAGGCK